MNFSIKKRSLLDSLNIASKAISSTTPLPILAGIKFLCENNSLIIITSDSNISIRTIISNEDLNILEEGGIVLDAKYIMEMVRKIDGDLITIEIIDGSLVKVSGGNSEFKINGMNVNDYPEINFNYSDNQITFDSHEFLDSVYKTIFACSESDTRPILTGVNFCAKDGLLTINATDSYRLACKKVDVDPELNFNITIPNKYLSLICHSLPEQGEFKISIDNQKISFLLGDTVLQTRLLDDNFPDTSKLIPSGFSQILKVKSSDLAKAIDRTTFIKTDGKNIVKLKIDDKVINITTSNNVGSSNEDVNVVSFEGEPFEISCSGKYLMDAIKAIDDEEIIISFSGILRPMIITNKDDNSVVQLISPVRTYR